MNNITTIFISILIAGIITHFPTKSSESQLNNNPTQKHSTQKIVAVQEPKSTIDEELITSWLSNSLTEQETVSKHDYFDTNELISIKESGQLVVLDISEIKQIFQADRITLVSPTYWDVVHSIESKQGKNMYRPRNKAKSCRNTNAPCGHYQISAQALKDIGCLSNQCKINRENHDISLEMSKKLEKINLNRLAKKGYSSLPDFQKYLIHQQGATGIRLILDAKSGKYTLGKRLTKNMANNSSYSYRQLKHLGSKQAAKKFLSYWENKWATEIDQLLDQQLTDQLASKSRTIVISSRDS